MTFGLFAYWGGLNLTYMLNEWSMAGVFTYVLPFLLIFAFVYALLSKTRILGDNKGANMIISLAVGGLALVGDYVPRFFQTIFPYTGMAISILLAAIILGGLFLGDTPWIKYIIIAVGVIGFLVVAYSSLSDYSFGGGFFWQEYGSTIIVLALIIGAIILVTRSSGFGGPFSGGHGGPRPY